ncbi:hypothetical protein G7Y31_02500 [Corynebacterium lizhenjunii]|uniref:PE domain-containing protein n=1 Tax=Corynebacterium lizhenjunii TaxID=2709394 RepID=A0A7T0KG36_9CORY|nr:hypothetical protein [Corynebacterium lizhenjunii]QPK79600.1 hypothetical protein G7Y31_02500 [Corynebacterium lizhenjunii]
MADVFVDVPQATTALQGVVKEIEGALDGHQAQRPAFPAQAAGKGFAGHAQRLQAAFERVHSRGSQRFVHARDTAQAAIAQLDAVAQGDEFSAQTLAGGDHIGGGGRP